MEGNNTLLNSSYYPQHHHHHQQSTTTTTTNHNGMFSSNTQNHQNQNHNVHVSSPHYSTSEPTPLAFSSHSVTPTSRGSLLPSSAPPPPPAPPPPLETLKRKRGRPRKYGTPDSASTIAFSSPTKTISSPPPKKEPSLHPSAKKSQLASLGNAGHGFTPHIITVAAGEDVAQKILSFTHQRKFAACVLSASGSISNASLRQAAMLGGDVTYEGRYEILSLSGSFLHNEVGGASSKSGGLSVCLSGTDGRVIGGGVGGPLIAAGPVQVIVGSFMYDVTKNAIADKKLEASLDKPPPQVLGASITSVTFRNAPDSFGRIPIREDDDHQNLGGNFMLQQPHGMDITSPHLTDWRVGPDVRGDTGYAGRTNHGECQSSDEGDDEHLE